MGCDLTVLIQARISSKLEALRAAFFEFAARRASDVVDRAGVATIPGSEMHAGAVLAGRETDQSEVTWLHRVRDVLPTDATPPREILRRDQDTPIGTGSAAGPAGEAVELVAHRKRV